MYCVECGAEEKIYGKVCLDCLLKNRELVTTPSHLRVTVCGDCGAILKGANWQNQPIEVIVEELLAARIDTDNIVEAVDLLIPALDYETAEKRIEAVAKLRIGDAVLDYPIKFMLRTNNSVCDMCSRQMGNYYEAIIQVRAEGREPTPEELESSTNLIMSKSDEMRRSDRQAFVTKVSEVKGGIDYYLGSAQSARGISRQLQDMHAAAFSETSTQAGHKDGKETFRNTFLIRLPRFKKGDVVTDGRAIFLIEKMTRKSLSIKDLETGHSRTMPENEMSQLKEVGNISDAEEAVMVSESELEIQILDPRTMKTIDVLKPPGFANEGNSVKVIRFEDRLFVV